MKGFGGTKKIEKEIEQRKIARERERRKGEGVYIESRKNETG